MQRTLDQFFASSTRHSSYTPKSKSKKLSPGKNLPSPSSLPRSSSPLQILNLDSPLSLTTPDETSYASVFLEIVSSCKPHVLLPNERQMQSSLLNSDFVSHADATVLFRLFNRKTTVFRQNNISPPIRDKILNDVGIESSISKLIRLGFFSTVCHLSLKEILNLLVVGELKTLAKDCRLNNSNLTTKSALIEALVACKNVTIDQFFNNRLNLRNNLVLNRAKVIVGPLFKISDLFSSLFDSCCLVYLGSFSWDLSLFTRPIAFHDYESNNVCLQIFSTQKQFSEFKKLKHLHHAISNVNSLTNDNIRHYLKYLDELLIKFDTASDVDSTCFSTVHFSFKKMYLNEIFRFAKRVSDDEALMFSIFEIFLLNFANFSLIAPFRKISTFICKYLNSLDGNDAFKFIKKISLYYTRLDICPPHLFYRLFRIHTKLLKKHPTFSEYFNFSTLKLSVDFPIQSLLSFNPNVLFIYAKRLSTNNSRVSYYLNDDIVTVESLVLELIQQNFQLFGAHSENKLFTFLFSLLFLEDLFDPSVPGTLPSSYCDHPLDLFTTFFYQRPSVKENLNRLSLIELPQLLHLVKRNYEKLKDRHVIFCRWNDKDFGLVFFIEVCCFFGGRKIVFNFPIFSYKSSRKHGRYARSLLLPPSSAK
ncbi:hypothetical protein GEMRC1_002930 [Eukaryota sp. GEM-RC1]